MTQQNAMFMSEAEERGLVIQPQTELVRHEPSTGELLELAFKQGAPIDTVERLVAMMERERTHQSNVGFDEALNRCQQKMERISADANNPQTHSRYATYAKLDRVLRPIYTAEGFSISFGEEDCPTPGKTRFVAYVSRSGITRPYRKDLTASTKGPKGNDVMTPIHAEGAADSYARRYLLKGIFNVAIGEDDTDGVTPASILTTDEQAIRLQEWADALRQCDDLAQLKNIFADAYKYAASVGAHEKSRMAGVYNECKARLQ